MCRQLTINYIRITFVTENIYFKTCRIKDVKCTSITVQWYYALIYFCPLFVELLLHMQDMTN